MLTIPQILRQLLFTQGASRAAIGWPCKKAEKQALVCITFEATKAATWQYDTNHTSLHSTAHTAAFRDISHYFPHGDCRCVNKNCQLTHNLITYIILQTNSTEHSPSSEADSFSAGQDIPLVLWNPKIQYRDLRSSGILRSVEWYFCTDVSGQPIGPIFKGQQVQNYTQRRVISHTSADLIYSAAEDWKLKFITEFTKAHHLYLSWARSSQSELIKILISSHLRLGFTSGVFSFSFPHNYYFTYSRKWTGWTAVTLVFVLPFINPSHDDFLSARVDTQKFTSINYISTIRLNKSFNTRFIGN